MCDCKLISWWCTGRHITELEWRNISMNVMGVVSAALVIGITGLFVGLLLVGAASKFHVNKDEREEKVRGLLQIGRAHV